MGTLGAGVFQAIYWAGLLSKDTGFYREKYMIHKDATQYKELFKAACYQYLLYIFTIYGLHNYLYLNTD